MSEKKLESTKIPFESYCKRLRNFPKWKNLEYNDFIAQAKIKYHEKYGVKEKSKNIENEIGTWINEEEAQKALDKFNNYKNNCQLETQFDLSLLRRLVYCEIHAQRIEQMINEGVCDNKVGAIKSYNELMNLILTIRDKLGLIKDKTQGIVEYIEGLKRKAVLWRKMNPNKSIPCAYCGNPLFLKLKDPQLYEAVKHPLFKGKILYNKALLDLIKEGKITLEDGANVLQTSSDMIKKMYNKEFNLVPEEVPEVPQQEVPQDSNPSQAPQDSQSS